MRSLIFGLVALTIALAIAADSFAETIVHPTPSFTFQVPDGFVPATPPLGQEKPLYLFVRPRDDYGRPAMTLRIVGLGGFLEREPVSAKKLAKLNADVKGFLERWKRFDIQVLRIGGEIDGVEYVTLAALVPLEPEAIRVEVIANVADEFEAWAVVQRFLDGLQGKSEWETREEISIRLGELFVEFFAAVIIGIFGWHFAQDRKAKKRRATELAAKRKTTNGSSTDEDIF